MFGVALALVLVVGAGVLLSNPRHRSFYFGGPQLHPPGTDRQRVTAAPPAPKKVAPSADADAMVGGPTSGGVGGKRRPPRPDVEGRVRIPVADQVPWRLPADGIPAGWELKEFSGSAGIQLVRTDGRLALHLRSDQSSFALYRDVLVDVTAFPVLSWSWKVTRQPPAGDVRGASTDDQAAQVYVVFPRWPSPQTSSDVVGYVWDSRAPLGTRLRSPKAGNVRIIVVESGPARLDRWQAYERNIAEDYAQLFGRRPPRVGMVALMIDSDDTRGRAEALLGEISFSRAGRGMREIPTSMLR